MVQVTDRALDKLEEMRQVGGLAQDQAIGIGVAEGGGLRFDLMQRGADDEVIEKDGTPVMIIPAVLSQPLEAAVLDFVDTPEEGRFTLSEAEAEAEPEATDDS